MAIRIQRNPKAVWRAIRAYGTQELMAGDLGVDRITVCDWAAGRRPVPWSFCVKIETSTRRIAQQKRDVDLVVTCEELQPGLDWEAVLQLALLRLGAAKTGAMA